VIRGGANVAESVIESIKSVIARGLSEAQLEFMLKEPKGMEKNLEEDSGMKS
jgi:hypothetical protein